MNTQEVMMRKDRARIKVIRLCCQQYLLKPVSMREIFCGDSYVCIWINILSGLSLSLALPHMYFLWPFFLQVLPFHSQLLYFFIYCPSFAQTPPTTLCKDTHSHTGYCLIHSTLVLVLSILPPPSSGLKIYAHRGPFLGSVCHKQRPWFCMYLHVCTDHLLSGGTLPQLYLWGSILSPTEKKIWARWGFMKWSLLLQS